MKAFLRFSIILTIGILLHSAAAGEFQRSDIFSQAKWLLHLDWDGVRDSNLGTYAFERDLGADLTGRLKMAETLFGFDARRDLRSLTMYGLLADAKESSTHTVIMLVRGRFDSTKIAAELKTRDGYKNLQHGKHQLIRVVIPPTLTELPADAAAQPNPPDAWCAFFDEHTFLVAEAHEQLALALDVLDGNAPSLEKSNPFSHLDRIQANSMVIATANLADMENIRPQAAIFREARSLSFGIAENRLNPEAPAGPTNTALDMLMLLEARTHEGSDQIKRTADGLLALAMLAPKDQPILNNLAKHIRITQDGLVVQLHFTYPVHELLALVTLIELRQAEQRPQEPGQ